MSTAKIPTDNLTAYFQGGSLASALERTQLVAEEEPTTSSPETAPAPTNCSSPEAGITCIDTTVDDHELFTSLGLNALMGIAVLVLFALVHSRMVVYKIRMILPQVTVKPRRLPKKGIMRYCGWLYNTFATSDQDLLASSGMDSLMLVKTMAFGVQLFLPLTIVAFIVLIPLHASGIKHGQKEDGKAFEIMTMSNVKEKSSNFWVHFGCVYAYIGYALLLLYYHQKRFVDLRHHYLTAGDDPNYWRIKYASAEETETKPQHRTTFAGAALQLSQFLKKATGLGNVIGKEYSQPKGILSTAAKTNDGGDAKKLLSDLTTNEPEQTGSESGSKNAFADKNLTEGLEATTASSSNTKESASGIMAQESEAEGTSGDEQEERPLLLSMTKSMFGFGGTSVNNNAAAPKILKWWEMEGDLLEDEESLPKHEHQRGVNTTRPSVRFLKTVNTEDLLTGEPVSINAQQYCVLITDVPDLEKLLKEEDRKRAKRNQRIDEPSMFVQVLRLVCQWICGGFKLTEFHPSSGTTQTRTRNRTIDPELMRKYGSKKQRNGLDSHMDGNSETEACQPNIFTKGNLMNKKKSKWGMIAEKVRTQEIFNLEECVVASSFRTLFPNDFIRAHPIRVHKKIDIMLSKWEKLAALIERKEYELSVSGLRPVVYPDRRRWSWLFCGLLGKGEPKDAIEHLNRRLHSLELDIEEKKKDVMANSPSSTWLLMFRTQFAATVAAQALLHSESGHKFQAHPAPGPDEMNWQALWKTWLQKDIRRVLVFPLIVGVIIFPLGIFAGALSKLTDVLCDENGIAYIGDSYCGLDNKDRLISPQKIISGWAPPVVVSIWQNAVMPNLIYFLVQTQASCISLSELDQEIASLFFYWDVLNIFVGGMLGGTILSKVSELIRQSESITVLLADALPASSNFFINYIVLRAFFLVPYQLMLPHPGVWQYLLRLIGVVRPKTARDRALFWKARSIRYGREYGVIMLIFLIAMVYSVIAPIIVPVTLVFFIVSWTTWRYQVLYVYVRKYESGGCMWPFVFHRVLVILWLFQVFTSCILTAKGAVTQASILTVTVPILLVKYWRYCEARFKSGQRYIPLEMAQLAPPAEIDANVYTAPALIPGCAGWHPEYLKAWEGWGAPGYCW